MLYNNKDVCVQKKTCIDRLVEIYIYKYIYIILLGMHNLYINNNNNHFNTRRLPQVYTYRTSVVGTYIKCMH